MIAPPAAPSAPPESARCSRWLILEQPASAPRQTSATTRFFLIPSPFDRPTSCHGPASGQAVGKSPPREQRAARGKIARRERKRLWLYCARVQGRASRRRPGASLQLFGGLRRGQTKPAAAHEPGDHDDARQRRRRRDEEEGDPVGLVDDPAG